MDSEASSRKRSEVRKTTVIEPLPHRTPLAPGSPKRLVKVKQTVLTCDNIVTNKGTTRSLTLVPGDVAKQGDNKQKHDKQVLPQFSLAGHEDLERCNPVKHLFTNVTEEKLISTHEPITSKNIGLYITKQRDLMKLKLKKDKDQIQTIKEKKKNNLQELQIKSKELIRKNLERKKIKGKGFNLPFNHGGVLSSNVITANLTNIEAICQGVALNTPIDNDALAFESETVINPLMQEVEVNCEKKTQLINKKSNFTTENVNIENQSVAFEKKVNDFIYKTSKNVGHFKLKNSSSWRNKCPPKHLLLRKRVSIKKLSKPKLSIPSDLYTNQLTFEYPYNFITAVKKKLSVTLKSPNNKLFQGMLSYNIKSPNLNNDVKNSKNKSYLLKIRKYWMDIMSKDPDLFNSSTYSILHYPEKNSNKILDKSHSNPMLKCGAKNYSKTKLSLSKPPPFVPIESTVPQEIIFPQEDVHNMTHSMPGSDNIEYKNITSSGKNNDQNNDFFDNYLFRNVTQRSKWKSVGMRPKTKDCNEIQKNIFKNRINSGIVNSSNYSINTAPMDGTTLEVPDLNLVRNKNVSDRIIHRNKENILSPAQYLNEQFKSELNLLDSFNESLRHVEVVEDNLTLMRHSTAQKSESETENTIIISKQLNQINQIETIGTENENCSLTILQTKANKGDFKNKSSRDQMADISSNNNLHADVSQLSNCASGIDDKFFMDHSLLQHSIIKSDGISAFDDTCPSQIIDRSASNCAQSVNSTVTNTLNRFCVCMVSQFIKDERVRSEYLEIFLKVREKSLMDATRSELMCLEILKKQSYDQVPLFKRKQRALILKLQQERNEIRHIKKFQQEQSQKRKEALKRQLKYFKAVISPETKEYDTKKNKLRKSNLILHSKKMDHSIPFKGFNITCTDESKSSKSFFTNLHEDLQTKRENIMKYKKKINDILILHCNLQLDSMELKAMENSLDTIRNNFVKNSTVKEDVTMDCHCMKNNDVNNSINSNNKIGALEVHFNDAEINITFNESIGKSKMSADLNKNNEKDKSNLVDQESPIFNFENISEDIINESCKFVDKIVAFTEQNNLSGHSLKETEHAALEPLSNEVERDCVIVRNDISVNDINTKQSKHNIIPQLDVSSTQTPGDKSGDCSRKNIRDDTKDSFIFMTESNLNKTNENNCGNNSLNYVSKDMFDYLLHEAKNVALNNNIVKSFQPEKEIPSQNKDIISQTLNISDNLITAEKKTMLLMSNSSIDEEIEMINPESSNDLKSSTVQLEQNGSEDNKCSMCDSSPVIICENINSDSVIIDHSLNTATDDSDNSKSTAHSLVEELVNLNNLQCIQSIDEFKLPDKEELKSKGHIEMVSKSFVSENPIINDSLIDSSTLPLKSPIVNKIENNILSITHVQNIHEHSPHGENIPHNLPTTTDSKDVHLSSHLSMPFDCDLITNDHKLRNENSNDNLFNSSTKTKLGNEPIEKVSNEFDELLFNFDEKSELLKGEINNEKSIMNTSFCNEILSDNTSLIENRKNSEDHLISEILKGSKEQEVQTIGKDFCEIGTTALKKSISSSKIEKSELLKDNEHKPEYTSETKTLKTNDALPPAWDSTSSSPELSPRDSPTGEYSPASAAVSVSLSRLHEAELLRRKQLAIELEIKALEQQQSQLPYCLVREIPDKPPPPYIPPVEDPKPYVSSITFKDTYLSPIVLNRTSHTIKTCCEWLYKQNISTKIKQDKLTFRSAHDVFLFDLCKEAFDVEFDDFNTKEGHLWEFKKKDLLKVPDKTSICLSVERKVKEHLSMDKWPAKGFHMMNWSHKRKDQLNELLIKELYKEEVDWANIEEHEVTVKNELTNSILESLIDDVCQEYELLYVS